MSKGTQTFDLKDSLDRTYPKLDRSTLPAPLSYLSSAGIRIGKRGGDWIGVCCPIHRGGAEKNPSMSVEANTGGFFCHTCGIKGGDIVALHRLIHPNLGFREAVADLGGRFNE